MSRYSNKLYSSSYKSRMNKRHRLARICAAVLCILTVLGMLFSIKPVISRAKILGNGENQISGFKFHVGSKDGDQVIIDRKPNSPKEYLISPLPFSKTYTLVPETGFEITKVEVDQKDLMNVAKQKMPDARYMYVLNAIKSYNNFALTVTLKNLNDDTVNVYTINIEFEENKSLQFNYIELRLDNDSPVPLYYNDQDKYGTITYEAQEKHKRAYFNVIGLDGKPMKFLLNNKTTKFMNLTGGDNVAEIKISSNEFSKVYTVIIPKTGTAKLKNLVPSVGKLSPAFAPDETEYEITVGSNVEKISFTPTAIDNSCTIKIGKITIASGKKSQDIKLKEGINEISIVVKNREGDTTIYTVSVYRTPPFRSSNLKSLKLSTGKMQPAFNKEIYDYEASVDNKVVTVSVTAVVEDAAAKIEINGYKTPSGAASKPITLDEGGNAIVIVVTDEKENVSTYTINVFRNYSKTNTRLESLTVTDGVFDPPFDSETYMYSVTIPRAVEEVRIKAETLNTKATYQVNGVTYSSGQSTEKIKLEMGANTVVVKVFAEDKKTSREYTLSLIRDKVQGTLADWVLVGGEWMYYDAQGIPAKNKWVIYNGLWYHLDINGYMDKNGWLYDGGEWYYLAPSGEMQTGWIKDTGYWYYFNENGPMVSNGWAFLDGKWYYFNESGQMQVGWLLWNGKYYYLNPATGGPLGSMMKGWIDYNKNKYYLNDDGTMRNGWLFNNEKWYYFNSSGAMVTGWQTINGKRYYFNNEGIMQSGKIVIDGQWVDLG